MGIREDGAECGQPLHVVSLHLGMTAQWSDPVVEIVEGDHQNIGRSRVGDGREGQCDESGGESIHGRGRLQQGRVGPWQEKATLA